MYVTYKAKCTTSFYIIRREQNESFLGAFIFEKEYKAGLIKLS